MRFPNVVIWFAMTIAIAVPIFAAAQSPLLAWREPIYIIASFAGIVGLTLLLVQPLLIIGAIPGVAPWRSHMWIGIGLTLAVTIHVAGLWLTSPPDVVDVLLLRSPTPFSVWGMLALCAIFAAAFLALIKKWIGIRTWRLGHTAAIVTIVIGTVLHAWLIQGTMESVTKAALCLAVLLAVAIALRRRRVWRLLR